AGGFLTSLRLPRPIKAFSIFSINTIPQTSVFLIALSTLPTFLTFYHPYWYIAVVLVVIFISIVGFEMYRRSTVVQHRLLKKMLDVL
ncbi:MAG: hypothetical protein WBA23_04755, partial [Tunicatimonas sp.]|uniref:hypothetical protein n=1 Tax=Tunicatimonas sp. TaxID=1940096 RepID=UPI003C77AF3C